MGGAMKLFKLFGEIGLDGVNEVEKDLDNTGKKAKQLKDNFKKNFDEMSTKVGDATKKIGLSLASIFFGAFWVFFLTSLAGCLLDLGFVIIQRFNRPRILKFDEKAFLN